MEQVLDDIKKCTGCTACQQICPHKSIKMTEASDGFLYPEIDSGKCVNCGLCRDICPVLNPPVKNPVREGYSMRVSDEKILRSSTSGGFMTAIAKYIFKADGVLFGVGYAEDKGRIYPKTYYVEKDNIKELDKMRGSKYVQSRLDNTFMTVKTFLKEGRLVCFIGTPCQVAGLKKYLISDQENLITVDLVCHGVSSPKLFDRYIKYMSERMKGKVIDARFRNKTYGYHSGTMKLRTSDGKAYYASGRVDHMLKAYFSGLCSRESCYECPFKGVERCSDFTIFDSFSVSKNAKVADDDKGYTNVFVRTEKAKKIYEEMSGYIKSYTADVDTMIKTDGVMIKNNPEKNPNRDKMFDELGDDNFEKVMQKYAHVSFTDKMLESTKRTLYRTGLLGLIKKVKK